VVALEDVVEKGSLARPAEAEEESEEVSDGSKGREATEGLGFLPCIQPSLPRAAHEKYDGDA
jgi:hypothetical protein